jgi:hypothetical protein
MNTHAEQANEHNDQQETVGDSYKDDGYFIAFVVGLTADALRRNPCRAELRMDKLGESEIF